MAQESARVRNAQKAIVECEKALLAVHNAENREEAIMACELMDINPASLMAEFIINKYREKRTAIKQYWYDTEAAAIRAVQNPGAIVKQGKCQWATDRQFLLCKLPSGRCLAYCEPELRPIMTPWGQEKLALHFMGVDSKTGQWVRQHTYGGKLVENITQATARDLLANGIVNCEKAGYSIVLHVHDELVAEVPETFGSLEEFEELMAKPPEWAEGCPVSTEGWRGKRYKK